jgi:plasmid stabilization system protein ParE
MAYKIVITEQAKEDTQTAYDYYEEQRQDLGEDFLEELVKKYDDLTENPQHYGYIDNQGIIRDVKIDRFPYVIVFEIIEQRVIVYAIHNTYRHPKRKLKR